MKLTRLAIAVSLLMVSSLATCFGEKPYRTTVCRDSLRRRWPIS